MMKSLLVSVLMLALMFGHAKPAQALVLDKMDNTSQFYMYNDKQVGLNLAHQMPGYIVLTKTKGSENFIRWSNPDKQPIKIGAYDTLEIDLADFASSTKLQILI